jgi:hypothetical protein
MFSAIFSTFVLNNCLRLRAGQQPPDTNRNPDLKRTRRASPFPINPPFFRRKGEVALLPTPQWALEIVKEVCAEYHREVPKIKWGKRRANGFESSGRYIRYKEGTIQVSVGRDNHEKQVLLHELSHHVNTNGGHGSSFYIILKRLLVKYDCLTEEYKKRQNNYRKSSIPYL